MIAANAYTGEVRVVEGFIENASGDSILVRGEYYSLSGVILENTSGKEVSKSDFKTGKKVEIFFKNGRITTILLIGDISE
jgi:hypothetical protein